MVADENEISPSDEATVEAAEEAVEEETGEDEEAAE